MLRPIFVIGLTFLFVLLIFEFSPHNSQLEAPLKQEVVSEVPDSATLKREKVYSSLQKTQTKSEVVFNEIPLSELNSSSNKEPLSTLSAAERDYNAMVSRERRNAHKQSQQAYKTANKEWQKKLQEARSSGNKVLVNELKKNSPNKKDQYNYF